jgi:hypothetical protein
MPTICGATRHKKELFVLESKTLPLRETMFIEKGFEEHNQASEPMKAALRVNT